LAAGVGYVHLQSEFDTFQGTTASFGGLAFQLDLGGAPANGVVLGAGLGGIIATDAEVEGPLGSSEAEVSFSTVGVFVSVFPDPRGGLELGAMAAVASAAQSGVDVGNDTSLYTDVTGPGVAVWASYNGWVSANWALGGLVRGSIGWMSGTTEEFRFEPVREIETTATARSLMLCFDAMYH
jgi:hypothetical protein